MIELVPESLTPESFRPFGEVIDLESAHRVLINYGLTTRFHDLATIDVGNAGGHALLNVFRTAPLPMPHRVAVMERHPLGSQAFLPMRPCRFLVLTAEGEDEPAPDSLRLFLSNGTQGVNYARNTWHHYQMVLDEEADFVVVDRGGSGDNLDEFDLSHLGVIVNAP